MSDETPAPKKRRKRDNPQTVADHQTAEFLAQMRDNTGIVIVVRSWSARDDQPDQTSIKVTNGIPRSAAAAVLWRAAVELDPDIANMHSLDDDDDDQDDDEPDEE